MNGALKTQADVLDSLGRYTKYYDTKNTHPYKELDVANDPDGKVTGAQVVLDQKVIDAGGAIGQIFGSALGSALGGKDQITRLASTVLGGTIGGVIGQQFVLVVATSMGADLSKVSLTDAFAGQNLANAGIGAIASFLTAELGSAMKIPGFGGQLFNAAANGFTTSVLTQVTSKIGEGLTFNAAIAAIDWGAAVSGAISAEGLNVVNLAGSFLGQLLVPAKSHAGAVGGQLLGAIGSFLLPGFGTLIGDILGTVIGDAFSNTPHPAATDLLDQRGYYYDYHSYVSFQGGSFEVPDKMGAPAIDIINAYLKAVNGAALDHSRQVVLGYQTDPASYVSGVPSHPSADGVFFAPGYAVQAAAVDVLQNTEVIGGDLILKRAHTNSSFHNPPPMPPADPSGDPGPTGAPFQPIATTQLAILSGDLGVAQDYENYLNNREAINALMAANPNSAFTAGWIATFARVQELGLNHVNPSDFTGGLVGFLDSVNKTGLGWAASTSVSTSGDFAHGVVNVFIRMPNGVEVPGSLAAFADVTYVGSDASGQTVQFYFGDNLGAGGFRRLDAGFTAGDGVNDIWFGDGSGRTFNGSGGHDILAGGSGNDTIHGGAGWDFVQGGAGNDVLFGDDGNDILRGDAGNDVLNGGTGFDVAVFGGKVGSYTLISYNGSIGVLSHGAEGSDRLEGIEFLQFADTGIAPGAVAGFDALAYIASYPDLIVAFGLNPQRGFDNYVGGGFAEGRSISFDPLRYIASNPDLIAAFGLNAASGEQHYITSGYYEHRATTSFDAFEYIASNPDLITAFGLNPLAGETHYITSGYFEHRATHSFDAVEYIASNPDLIVTLGLNPLAAEQQYIASGFNAHRPTASFNTAQYLANYPDLAAAFGNNLVAAEQHYIVSGFYEGRTDKLNHAPVLTVPANSIKADPGQVMQVSSWFTATDADNDALTYRFADGTPAANSGQFVLNGTPLGQGAAFTVTAAQLAGLTFVAGTDGVADGLSMQLSDGHAMSANLALSVHVNHAPVLTVAASNIPANAHQSMQVSSWFSAADADNDALTFTFADSSPAANSGHFVLNGTPVAGNTFNVTAAQLSQLTFVAGAAASDDALAVQLSDGHAVSAAGQFHVHAAAPTPSDFNGDAKSDLLLLNNSTGGLYVCVMNGAVMGDNALALTIATTSGWHYQGLGDFDGDHKSDVLLLNYTSAGVYVCEMNGTQLGTNAQAFRIDSPSGWHFQDLGDFNGDGKSDVLLMNSVTNGVYVCEMNGTELATNGLSFNVAAADGWHYQGLGDFNGDGKSDILLLNSVTNGVYVCEMNGTELAGNGLSLNVNAAGGWHFQGLADFNGDGKSDILLLNSVTNGVYVCEMDGSQMAANGLAGTMASGWHFADTGDFNGDGKADLLLLNDSTRGVMEWQMDGTQVQAAVQVGTALAGTHYLGKGDYNGDGKTDLVFQNDATGAEQLWQMNGTAILENAQMAQLAAGWHLAI